MKDGPPQLRWIQLIDPRQSVIQLNDRQCYEVKPGDAKVLSSWSPPQQVVVKRASPQGKFPRMLTNRDRDESVRIRRSKPVSRRAV